MFILNFTHIFHYQVFDSLFKDNAIESNEKVNLYIEDPFYQERNISENIVIIV